jgi:hypothetical protein
MNSFPCGLENDAAVTQFKAKEKEIAKLQEEREAIRKELRQVSQRTGRKRQKKPQQLYTDTGEVYGPFGSLPLAQKHARAKLVENTRMKAVELRPSVSPVKGGYGPRHRLSSC